MMGKLKKSKKSPTDSKVRVSEFSRFTLNKWKRKYTYILLGLILVLIIAAAAIFWWNSSQPSSSSNESNRVAVCSSEFLDKSKKVFNLDPADLDALDNIKNETIQLPDYDQDATCLYIVTKYYTQIGDSIGARKSFDKLQEVYLANDELDSSFSSAGIESPEELLPIIEFLEAQAEKYENMKTFGAPLELPQ